MLRTQPVPVREQRARWQRWLPLLAGPLALLGWITALLQLWLPTQTVAIERTTFRSIPVTVYQPSTGPGPAVIIAHGFSGSQQLMQPFAVTLARNGYTALLFDFPGHAANPEPLRGSFEQIELRFRQLVGTLDDVAALARERGDGRVALLGHSMGAEAVVRYAQSEPAIPATVAVSMYYEGVTPTSPPNLLVLTGGLESSLQPGAQAIVDQVANGSGQTDTTYGIFDAGTARRIVTAPSVEHIGVLYSATSLRESLRWFDQAFGRPSSPAPFVDNRTPWLALLFGSATVLFWPLLRMVQWSKLTQQQPGEPATLPGRVFKRDWLALAIVPALLTPFVLRLIPSENILPILVGGSLALFFALYGILTRLGLAIGVRVHASARPQTSPPQNMQIIDGQRYRVLWPSDGTPASAQSSTNGHHRANGHNPTAQQPTTQSTPRPVARWRRMSLALLGALLMVTCAGLFFALPLHLFVINILTPLQRLPIFVIVLVAMLPFFVFDEWLARMPGAPRGAYAITKICFMLSLVLAIAVNQNLFFLALIAPVFVLYFLIFGTWSGLLYRHTGTRLAGALANAVIFAWSATAIFPLVG